MCIILALQVGRRCCNPIEDCQNAFNNWLSNHIDSTHQLNDLLFSISFRYYCILWQCEIAISILIDFRLVPDQAQSMYKFWVAIRNLKGVGTWFGLDIFIVRANTAGVKFIFQEFLSFHWDSLIWVAIKRTFTVLS